MDQSQQAQRQQVVSIAKTWLKTPYRHQGRVKGAGTDCLCILVEVYSEAGLIPPIELPYYPRDWHMHRSTERYLQGLLKYTREVDAPLPGDIVLWQFGRCFSHAAIVVEWPMVIHAWVGVGCVLEDVTAAQTFRFKKDGAARPMKFFSYWKA